jgi:hypothetical protein
MKKYLTFVLCSIAFGFVGSRACGSDYEAAHPALSFTAFKPVQGNACQCASGEPCSCGDNCACTEGVGCSGASRRAARQAARNGAMVVDDATYSVGFDPQQLGIVQPVAAADPDVCPCCGMKMTAEQKAKMKIPVPQAAPIQPVTTYTTMPMNSYFGGQMATGNCANGSCGTGFRTFRIFRR